MDEMKQLLKNVTKKAFKVVKKAVLPILIPVLAVVLIIVILAGSVYFITIDDGSYKEDDWSSPPYAAAVYSSSATVDSEGKITTGKTAQEIWDEMKKNNSRVDLYLDGPEQLSKLMNAEIVTKYPDTRSNPDEPIDWKNIDFENNQIQGIIKFKRADKDGNVSTMIYTDSETFESKIKEYNESGSDSAKEFVLSHFTIDKQSNADSTSSSVKVDGPELCWPVSPQFTTITSKFGYRGNIGVDGASENHGAIDIAGAGIDGTPVYACEEGTVLYTTNSGDYNGGAGNWVVIDHGNGYVSKYMHHQTGSTVVSPGDKVKKGQMIAKVGTTGASSGPHCHFQIEKDGVKIDPLQFKYNNGMGDGSGGFGSGSNSSTNDMASSEDTESSEDTASSNDSKSSTRPAATTCYVKVATWTQTNTKVETNDPNVKASDKTVYNMTTTEINYQELVDKYTMPFDLLWALLVVGESQGFVMELADLAYNSEIEITVYDNYRKNTDIDKWTYKKQDKVKGSGSLEDTKHNNTETVQDFEDITEYNYTTTKTVITQTNTLQIDLTKADTWIVDYTREYTHQDTETSTNNNEEKVDNTEWKKAGDQPDPNTYSNSNNIAAENKLKERARSQDDTETGEVSSYPEEQVNIKRHLTLNKETHYVEIKDSITNTVESTYYEAGSPKVKEKTDRQDKVDEKDLKPNFVTIFRKSKYSTNKSNILSASSWLFEILETNESTADMVDIVKYLLYKATGNNYGVTEFDFSIFDASKFQSVNSGESGGVVEMLKSFENNALREYMNGGNISYSSVSEYVTQDRKQYKMYYTSFDGCLNFSYGVMVRNAAGNINNESYFKDEGVNLKSLLDQYDAGKEVLVDADIVDRIKDKIVSDKKNALKKEIAKHGIEMKENQIDALTMVSYQYGNCGQYISGNQNIAEVYKNYYKKGDKDGFKNNAVCQTQVGLTHFFVTGQYPQREKYTWKLFNEGIYTLADGTVLTNSGSGSGGGKAAILQSAKKIHTYMEQHSYYYSLNGGVLKSTFEESKNSRGVCCATYVMWVLKDCGLINQTSHSAPGLASILQDTYHWKKINRDQLQAGDVIYYPYGHIEIYAGNGQIYNAGSDSAISRANPYTSNWYLTNQSYGLRAP